MVIYYANRVKVIVFHAFKQDHKMLTTFYCIVDIISPFCSFEKLCAWRVVRGFWMKRAVSNKNQFMLRGRSLQLSNYLLVLALTTFYNYYTFQKLLKFSNSWNARLRTLPVFSCPRAFEKARMRMFVKN